MNIRPMLTIKNPQLYISLWKTILSFFNLVHGFPYSLWYRFDGRRIRCVVCGAVVFCYIFTVIHQQFYIILSNKDNLFTIFLIVAAALGGLQYYGFQPWTGPIIQCYVR
jgi:hypothetical protein